MSPAQFPSKLSNLPSIGLKSSLIQAVVEAQKGSACKYKYDPEHGIFQLHKLLPLGAQFPHAFGFIPSTKGEDGDPLDILIISREPLMVGTVVTVRLLGGLKASQVEKSNKVVRNDRIIGCLETPYNPAETRKIEDLDPRHRKEIEHFFINYNELEGRKFQPEGWYGSIEALNLIEKGQS